MKAAIIALLVLTAPALAMDDIEFRGIQEEWMHAQWTCRSGEDHDGGPVTYAEVQDACAEQTALQTALKQAGYCYAGDMEWIACQ